MVVSIGKKKNKVSDVLPYYNEERMGNHNTFFRQFDSSYMRDISLSCKSKCVAHKKEACVLTFETYRNILKISAKVTHNIYY